MISAHQRARHVACAVAASAFLLTSCTSGDDHDKTAGSPTPTHSISHTADASSEAVLTEQVQDALAAVKQGTLLEAGVERVSDGIHSAPGLTKGKTYRLNLICVGSGTAQVKFTPTLKDAKTTVPCNQSIVQQRITAPTSVRIDVEGAPGATGVIGWEIDAT